VQPIGPPRATGPGGNYTVDELTSQNRIAVDQANQRVADVWAQIKPLQDQYNNLANPTLPDGSPNPNYTPDIARQQIIGAQLTSQLTSLYANLQQASSGVETANTALSTALQSAIRTTTVDPAQANYYNQQAAYAGQQAALAREQADALQKGSKGQRDLVAAQIGKTIDDGALSEAQAAVQDAIATQRTPAEVQQLQADANLRQAQADSTNALIDANKRKVEAEVGLTEAQTTLTGSQSDLAKAQASAEQQRGSLAQAQADLTRARIPGETGLLGAQTTLAGAQAGLAGGQTLQAQAGALSDLATAQQTLANIQKNRLGPLYGLQDQIDAINAIARQVWGGGAPGVSNEDRIQQANDMLGQYVQAAIGGTTPFGAALGAGNLAQQGYASQAGMINAAQSAQAARANAYQGLAGNVLGTLAQMNANAPAGSTAMVGAFNDIMSNLAQRMQAPQFAAPQMPAPPQLPAFLQSFANAPAPSTSAPVTINIGGAGTQPTVAPPQGTTSYTNPGLNLGALPGAGSQGQQSTPLPGALQGYAPATMDSLHSLWGNELQNGAVTSPFQGAGGF
jgi:hypothetical protein